MNNFRGLEWILVFCVMFVVMNSSFKTYQTVMIYAKEVALKNELNEIRNSIELYKIKYGKIPESLKELESKGFITFEGNQFFFFQPKKAKKNKVGAIVDPFNTPYYYDVKRGKVYSTTKGYEKY